MNENSISPIARGFPLQIYTQYCPNELVSHRLAYACSSWDWENVVVDLVFWLAISFAITVGIDSVTMKRYTE